MVKYHSSMYSKIFTYLSMRERIAAPTVIRFSFYIQHSTFITPFNSSTGYHLPLSSEGTEKVDNTTYI